MHAHSLQKGYQPRWHKHAFEARLSLRAPDLLKKLPARRAVV
jgi:hypothetical protein